MIIALFQYFPYQQHSFFYGMPGSGIGTNPAVLQERLYLYFRSWVWYDYSVQQNGREPVIPAITGL